jgi:folate-dependent phosphoribosylglycinamide formyltransferase PurN
MRIVFLSVDDEYAGEMQRFLYDRHPDWIVGSVISTRYIYKKTRAEALVFVVRRSGFRYLAQMVRIKILKKLFGPSRQDRALPSKLANSHAVPICLSADINSEKSRSVLASWKPDIIISTNFSHYIGRKVRNIAAIGTWNLHKSYLPNYRGMSPSFFALLEGASSAGSTLHIVEDGFDTGDILTQAKVEIGPQDTVYSLNIRTSQVGGRMLAQYLDEHPDRQFVATPQRSGDWKSYTYPSRREIAQFRRQGLLFDRSWR